MPDPVRSYLNEYHQKLWDKFADTALKGGCDTHQADQIAKERTLLVIMKASAAIANVRAELQNVGGADPKKRRYKRKKKAEGDVTAPVKKIKLTPRSTDAATERS